MGECACLAYIQRKFRIPAENRSARSQQSLSSLARTSTKKASLLYLSSSKMKVNSEEHHSMVWHDLKILSGD